MGNEREIKSAHSSQFSCPFFALHMLTVGRGDFCQGEQSAVNIVDVHGIE
jgi:hypothetical protein